MRFDNLLEQVTFSLVDFRRWRTLFAIGVAVTPAVGARSADLVRQPNATLTLPPAPPELGYAAPDAFPPLVFSQPVAIVSPPGEVERLFVVEKPGRIVVITNLAAPTRSLFLDLSARVNPSGEGGVLGLAFHPDYAHNRQFFVFYTLTTTTAGGTGFHDRLARFEADPANPNRALAASEVPLLTQFDQADNHNAGAVAFGPDGYLYVSLGDEGGGGDTYGNSGLIDRDFFSGILRLDVDRRPGNLPPNPHPAVNGPYAVPVDNPFVGATSFLGRTVNPAQVRTEFWAVGLRNPWRMAFDPFTGFLYCGDVGQGAREEIDIIRRGGHYGWNYREGTSAYRSPSPAGAEFVEPILDYPHAGSSTQIGRSVTGGVVYRGSRLSQLFGRYIFGDYGSGNVWALHYDGTRATEFRHLLTANGVVAFGTDPASGDVLFAEIGTGRLRRLAYEGVPVGRPLPATLAATGAFANLLSLEPAPGIVPYEINVPFWSDHALKRRWFSVPNPAETIGFSPAGNGSFPTGTVWIKHFDLELTNGVASSRRRLETRFLVRNASGVYGLTYRWDEAQADAQLVPEEGADEEFLVHDGGTTRTQVWRYPSRSECLQCHTPVAGYALGFGTFQLNRSTDYGQGPVNQIESLANAGYFTEPPANRHQLGALAPADLATASLEYRVRSYLQANCAQCHQPGGPALGRWDGRVTTPTAAAGLVHGLPVNTPQGAGLELIRPGDPANSALLQRLSTPGPGHMPPLASREPDTNAIALLTAWIAAELPANPLFPDWQQQQFGSSNAPEAAPEADPDADGASNALEYLTKTDPWHPEDPWRLTLQTSDPGARLEFTRVANRGFEIQWTEALGPNALWRPLDVQENAPFFGFADRPAQITDAVPGPERYYRVRIFTP